MMPASSTNSKIERARLAVEEANAYVDSGSPEDAARLLETVLAEGGWTGDVHAVLAHNLVTTFRAVTARHLEQGELESAVIIADKALTVPVPDSTSDEMLRHRADVFAGMALSFHEVGLVKAEVLLQRKAIALYPCPTYSNNLINALAAIRAPSVLTDYCDTLSPSELAPHIF